ncbi:MAG: glycosyltransferase family 2 protein [Flavobacteriales bacterium]|nr:glycosyltransferase family 2 protein [Flavobacteriales bacterium]MCB9167940.1 glycosyltransferase family 2 protein [Flavobacteriales bacterium]
MSTIAIVVLNWNGQHWLERSMPGILASAVDQAEVIVADNGSTDGSSDWLAGTYPDVRRIDLGHNMGFAGGYNAALAQVDTTYVVLLNTDVEVRPGWIAPLRALLERDPRMAACQPKVLALNDPQRFEHAGAAGGMIDRNGYPFCRGRIFELTEEDRGQYDDEREVFWATGACMMLRMAAFREVGGFDASLFAHMEEIDLCWRMRLRGWRIGFTSRSVIEHAGGGTLGYGSPRKTYLNFRNSLIVLTKNIQSDHLPYRLVRRLVLDGFAAAKFLLEGHFRHCWEVGRAHRHFFARLPAVLRERRRSKDQWKAPDLTGMYRRSVAYDRFILGHRRFTDLDPAAFIERDAGDGQRPSDSRRGRNP